MIDAHSTRDIAISVQNVSKTFKLPHERQTSIKSLFINFYRRKRTYEKQQVLRDVTFEIKKGEFFGIVGRNGSGKSTMLKLLAGIYTPSEGTIEVNGKLTPFIELGVGFNQELTGRENVFLNGALLGFTRKQMQKMYNEIVDFAEIERFMDQKLKNYSSGMQVRLAFSIAIRAQTDILLIDEVLAVGDANFQQKCFDYFYELKNSKQTVVFVSHDMEAVQRFCERAILIDNGKITAQGKTDKVVQEYLVENFQTKEQKKAPKEANDKKPAKPTVAAIRKLEILSDKKLKSSDTLKIRVYYELMKNRPIELRVAIAKEGIAFAHFNNRETDLPTTAGRYYADFEASMASFMDGEHHIHCGVFDAESYEQYDLQNNADSFYITDKDYRRSGLVRVDGKWVKMAKENTPTATGASRR